MASASDGDAIFVLTDADGGKHEVQVHSIVLKLASKVFAAMFGPHFSEGQDLNSNSPKRVEMPDDEPEAMKLLCDALHHRLEDTLTAPRGSLLDHVVKLVDKYDCSAAMMGISTVWMYKLIEDAKYMDYEGWERLLPVAYLFNNAQSFYEVTKGLVYHYDGFFSSIEHEMMDCLPTGVLALLAESRHNIYTKVAMWALECYQTYEVDLGPCENDCGVDPKGSRAFEFIALFGCDTSFAELLRNSTDIDYAKDFFELSDCPSHSKDRYKLNHEFHVYLEDTLDCIEGLCFKCIKAKKKQKECLHNY